VLTIDTGFTFWIGINSYNMYATTMGTKNNDIN